MEIPSLTQERTEVSLEREVVFVPAVEGGLDLAWRAGRLAEASLALYDALLDLE